MMITHAYTPNGLGAYDENGNVRCTCGHLEGAHTRSRHRDTDDDARDLDESKKFLRMQRDSRNG